LLPPHELKNKTFTRVIRGYSSVEVDEHIEFLLQKYTELYRENDELERKLKTATAKLDQFKTDEESIRSALINAQRASSKILKEANERADLIVRSAKTNCDKIIADFRQQIKTERDTLYKLRQQIAQFKAGVFEQYRTHIEYLESVSPDIDDSAEWAISDEDYTRKVVENVKVDVAEAIANENSQNSAADYEASDVPAVETVYIPDAENTTQNALPDVDAQNMDIAVGDDDSEKTKEISIPKQILDTLQDKPESIDNTQTETAEDNTNADLEQTRTFKIQRSSVTVDDTGKPEEAEAKDQDSDISDDVGIKNAIFELNKMLADESAEDKEINQDDLLGALSGELEKEKALSDEAKSEASENGEKSSGRNPKNNKKDKKQKLTSTQEFELVYGIDNGDKK